MDSPGQSTFFEDVLPSTSAFVAPGQEDLFLLKPNGSPQPCGSGLLQGSPGQLGNTWPGRGASSYFPGYSHSNNYSLPHALQNSPQMRNSPITAPQQHLRNLPYAIQHHQLSPQDLANLAALDLAPATCGSPCPCPRGPGGSGPSSSAVRQGSPPAQAAAVQATTSPDGNLAPNQDSLYLSQSEQWSYGASQQHQQQLQQCHPNRLRQQQLDARFAAAAAGPGAVHGRTGAVLCPGVGIPSQTTAPYDAGATLSYGLPLAQAQVSEQEAAFRQQFQQGYPQQQHFQQEGHPQHYAYHATAFADPGIAPRMLNPHHPHPYNQVAAGSTTGAGLQAPDPHAFQALHASAAFQAPASIAAGCWSAADVAHLMSAYMPSAAAAAAAAAQSPPGSATAPLTGSAAAAAQNMYTSAAAATMSPPSPHGAEVLAAPSAATASGGVSSPAALAAVGGQHGAVRHVVEELRTSPLGGGGGFDSPGRGGGRGRGGSAGGGDGGAQRFQAQILSLERQNAELQKRLADTQAALEAAQQAKQALEAKQDALKDQAAQAASNAKSREGALEAARRANDALSGELRGCQEELAAARDSLAAAKDTAVQWQDRAVELGKELEAARKKIETLGEEERRLSSETMSMRKEVQQMNDVIIKGRIETAELREKLRVAQQDSARAVSTAHAVAYRAESEQEGAAAQLALMRNRLAEVEARNSQLLYDLTAAREEASRARQAAEATRAAMAAKPAGIVTDGGPSSARHYGGVFSQNWMASDAAPMTASLPSTSAAAAASGAHHSSDPRLAGRLALLPPTSSSSSASAAAAAGHYSYPAPPPQQQQQYQPQQLQQHSSPDGSTVAAVLRSLPPDVAFSKLDPETFRSMVRAEAEALARASASGGPGQGPLRGGYDAVQPPGPASPRQPSYGSSNRYGGGYRHEAGGGEGGVGGYNDMMPSSAAEAMNSSQGVPSSMRVPWVKTSIDMYDGHSNISKPGGDAGGGVRDSLQALLPDPRASWAAQLSETRGYGNAGDGRAAAVSSPPGHATWQPQQQQQRQEPQQQQPPRHQQPTASGSSSSPPPYAIHTVDSSYAYRRPPNAVGAGTGPPPAHGSDTPFGTEMTTKELMARSKALEDQLMVLCAEKGGLEAEYARMPLGAGRNQRERARKAVVEQRLELLNKEISGVRMQLKKLGVK